MFEFMTIRELYEIVLGGSHVEIDSIEYVQLQGWVRTNRSSGKIGFIELNDGTYFRNAQLVYSSDLKDFNEVEKYTTGSALTVMGKFVYTPQGKQPFEIQVKEIELEGACDHDYPLQKSVTALSFCGRSRICARVPTASMRSSVCARCFRWPFMSFSRIRALSMCIRRSSPAMMLRVPARPLP